MRTLLKAALVAASVSFVGGAAHTQEAEAPRQITVVGTGSVTTTPDIMRITLVVLAEAPEASDAIREMSGQLDEVMRALASAGLPSRDIQTTGLRLSQRHAARTGRLHGL